MNQVKSGIIYRGPSLLDGAPIVAVAVFSAANTKTGAMLQTYILPDNGVSPLDNAKSLADASVCGACPHRRGLGGACYVMLHQGPRAVWSALMGGKYADATNWTALRALGASRMVRLGTYGDPAAVPYLVWAGLLDLAKGHTGYTHQSRHPSFDRRMLDLCMVSVDTEGQYKLAKKRHPEARTFRVMGANDTLQAGEIECLAETKGLTCAECGVCDGAGSDADVAIRVHGALAPRYEAKLGKLAVTQL